MQDHPDSLLCYKLSICEWSGYVKSYQFVYTDKQLVLQVINLFYDQVMLTVISLFILTSS